MARCPWKKLLSNIKISGRMRDNHLNKKPKEINVTAQDLEELFELQQRHCYWFGIELDPQDIFIPYNPLAVSADKILGNEDYSKDNLVICCRLANLGRGSCEHDRFTGIVKQIKNHILEGN